ncbi:hypothetical protein [Actinocatenispora rupis]|uniref:Uncharacterized protein n=1 Tax=Actinocatenispora rupis TaxID=519421 RepID=A0A8J3J704_9ACTN|nr:hypothetical protein [Actinocatenispora rupis]GID12781.1 hypothetical protein Aru02nite_36700 [Actinocatenispora rupis]
MPAPVSILIAFGLIAGLAIVLRWTYGSDLAERRYQVSPADDDPITPAAATGPPFPAHDLVPDGAHEAIDPAPHDHRVDAAESGDEGFGLLRTAYVADTDRAASLVREVLAEAGIRSTVAHRAGRLAVMVFADQLDEARRLVG